MNSQIDKSQINKQEELETEDNIYLFLNECYNNNYNKMNNFIKSFIKIIYKNNIVSTKNNLVNYNEIQKLLFNYKQYNLKQISINQNKNKVFNNNIKLLNIEIKKLNVKEKLLNKKIYEIRLNKIKYYKNMNNNFYNNLLDTISHNLEDDIKSINKTFFFDSNDIYKLIKNIKNIHIQIQSINKQKYVINYRKKLYNSDNMNVLLSNIKLKKNQNNNELICNELIHNKINYYPIIIKNMSKFNYFYNLINYHVFLSRIEKMIFMNKNIILNLNEKEIKYKKILKELEDMISFKKH